MSISRPKSDEPEIMIEPFPPLTDAERDFLLREAGYHLIGKMTREEFEERYGPNGRP